MVYLAGLAWAYFVLLRSRRVAPAEVVVARFCMVWWIRGGMKSNQSEELGARI